MLKKPYLAKSTTNEADIVHTVFDPAFDLEASDLQQYFLTHDAAHLVTKQGEVPVKFHIRALSRPKLNRIRLAASADVEQPDHSIPLRSLAMAVNARAFKEGCFKVTDCPVEQADGSVVREEITAHDAITWMDADIIDDIGERIVGISELALSGERSPGKP